MSAKVLIVMGSDSDFPMMQACIEALSSFGVSFEMKVCSAHRTPHQAHELAAGARDAGYQVIIAAAGLAAHLAGAMAANSTLPIIGVPIEGGPLKGLDALYSTVMMPGGVPVACMGIGSSGAKNAGLFAVQILSLQDADLAQKFAEGRGEMAKQVQAKDAKLQTRLEEFRANN